MIHTERFRDSSESNVYCNILRFVDCLIWRTSSLTFPRTLCVIFTNYLILRRIPMSFTYTCSSTCTIFLFFILALKLISCYTSKSLKYWNVCGKYFCIQHGPTCTLLNSHSFCDTKLCRRTRKSEYTVKICKWRTYALSDWNACNSKWILRSYNL